MRWLSYNAALTVSANALRCTVASHKIAPRLIAILWHSMGGYLFTICSAGTSCTCISAGTMAPQRFPGNMGLRQACAEGWTGGSRPLWLQLHFFNLGSANLPAAWRCAPAGAGLPLRAGRAHCAGHRRDAAAGRRAVAAGSACHALPRLSRLACLPPLPHTPRCPCLIHHHAAPHTACPPPAPRTPCCLRLPARGGSRRWWCSGCSRAAPPPYQPARHQLPLKAKRSLSPHLPS